MTFDDAGETNKTIFYTALYHACLVPWIIGQHIFDGYVDDVRVFAAPLSAEEIGEVRGGNKKRK